MDRATDVLNGSGTETYFVFTGLRCVNRDGNREGVGVYASERCTTEVTLHYNLMNLAFFLLK